MVLTASWGNFRAAKTIIRLTATRQILLSGICLSSLHRIAYFSKMYLISSLGVGWSCLGQVGHLANLPHARLTNLPLYVFSCFQPIWNNTQLIEPPYGGIWPWSSRSFMVKIIIKRLVCTPNPASSSSSSSYYYYYNNPAFRQWVCQSVCVQQIWHAISQASLNRFTPNLGWWTGG